MPCVREMRTKVAARCIPERRRCPCGRNSRMSRTLVTVVWSRHSLMPVDWAGQTLLSHNTRDDVEGVVRAVHDDAGLNLEQMAAPAVRTCSSATSPTPLAPSVPSLCAGVLRIVGGKTAVVLESQAADGFATWPSTGTRPTRFSRPCAASARPPVWACGSP